MDSNEYIDRLRHLQWLKEIAKDYKEYVAEIEKAGEDFTIEAIGYSNRGPSTPMRINPHRPIKAKYLRDALYDALSDLEDEIAKLKTKLKSVTVELSTTQTELP